MGKGRPRAVQKGVLGPNHHSASCSSSSSAAGAQTSIPDAPVYYPTEEEFKDPLEFISNIRPEAEPFGICRIVPPKGWNPPFALDLDSFIFPTKSQAIHRLQARPASCDSETFELEYNRFLESHSGRKPKRRVVFEGEDLDLCRLFNGVRRYGGYDKVCKEKKWGDVYRFMRSVGKISECSKHVLCQLYREHLYDYEEYRRHLDRGAKKCKRGKICEEKKSVEELEGPDWKRRKKSSGMEKVKKAFKEELDQICEQCESGLHGDVMLLCDRCDKGWHLYCLSPPLERVPSGNWYCLECVNSEKDSFGFFPGRQYSLEAFRKMDDRARRKWTGLAHATRSLIEKQFWEIVEGKAGEVEVMYGSDLDTSLLGSGFPRTNDLIPSSVDPELWKEYSSSPWNLNNLPKLQGSMLRAVHDNIAGVMVPWLYIGMLFSSFCWHVEDHCFYSMNYLHWGEPKCWYGIPGSEAHAFEQVMRNTLPDLFDAQPDLLFQLVTMLNPSVLQENGVPVYGVLQEPGNFVITFPRSFHGGFNFGLNCAEAVNFAPADWLPHGGFGAELYRLYHKPAVLSHEELLCVVAKSGCDAKVLPYVKEEMHRIFTNEKTFRLELWRNGIVKSSPMSPRKHPEYVGTEEDPTCIICQQYLFLSAIKCSCRPSALVCLEHWKNLCECNPSKHCLLYRHTLAELNDLIHMGSSVSSATWSLEGMPHIIGRRPLSNAMTKKVKGGHVAHAQLAEDWLLKSCRIIEMPFSNAAYANALKEAEQFIWADHEMDPVRDITNKLIKAQHWAVDLRTCLAKVDNWLRSRDKDIEKVSLSDVEELLHFDPLPCNDPGQSKLKAFADGARTLKIEVASALSSCSASSIGELEILHARVIKCPIYLEESAKLEREIFTVKAWVDRVRECLMEKKPGAIEIDALHMLKSEMLELNVQLPEKELLLDLLREVGSWQTRCRKILKGPIKLKELENFLHDADSLTVSFPELKLLRQYLSDAQSWISHLCDVLQNLKEREDHSKIVEELTCVSKAGEMLKVQVDDLPLVKTELRKSCCREKAVKALAIKMPLESIQQLMTEAALLNIENEKLFQEMSQIFAAAISWEERARQVLECAAQMIEFEDIIRISESIFAILPSLPYVKDALSVAHSWIRRSKPFLISNICAGCASDPFLKIDDLKELVTQSKLLKVTLKAPERLQDLLKDVECWQHNARSFLDQSVSLFEMHDIDIRVDTELLVRLEELLSSIDLSIKAGLSLGFDFHEMPELQHASVTLQWSLKALSLCSRIPLIEEVDSLLEDADHLPAATFAGNMIGRKLVDGVRWLKNALIVVPEPHSSRRCKLDDVEEVLEKVQGVDVEFPVMVARLRNAIEMHESWLQEVHAFFKSESSKQSWSLLLKLKECGESNAFDSPELNKVVSDIEKVEKWILQCYDIVKPSVGDLGSLIDMLVKIKDSLDRALCIYRRSKGCRERAFCVCCSNDSEKEEVFTCLTCEDWYHLSCMGPPLATAGMTNEYACPFCLCIESGVVSRNGGRPLMCRGKRPKLKLFIDLLSDAKDFYTGVEERDLVQEIVERALECKSCLNEIVNHALAHLGKDLSSVSESLSCALKAFAVSGVYDHQDSCNLESALTRNSWKIRVKKLLKGSRKPVIQQIERILKEGLAISIPPEDCFMCELTQVKHSCLQWADLAKKVASDTGALELNEVFKLINEGENLPVYFEKELKLLRARSVLYCICRKPYDQRAMIACDQCDEWYHFDCLNLQEPPPKTFFCPACKPLNGEFISLPPLVQNEERSSTNEPRTPPPRYHESNRRQPRKATCGLQHKMLGTADCNNVLRCSSKIDNLWRENRRPCRRTARRRSQFESLSVFQFTSVNE